MPPVRRLTAIIAADVAGASRVMVADEERTRVALKKLRRESPIPKSGSTAAQIDKITGDDGLLESAGIFRRRHGREEPVIKLTLGAARSPYNAYGLI
jgi:class 3 adenylate cyclase